MNAAAASSSGRRGRIFQATLARRSGAEGPRERLPGRSSPGRRPPCSRSAASPSPGPSDATTRSSTSTASTNRLRPAQRICEHRGGIRDGRRARRLVHGPSPSAPSTRPGRRPPPPCRAPAAGTADRPMAPVPPAPAAGGRLSSRGRPDGPPPMLRRRGARPPRVAAGSVASRCLRDTCRPRPVARRARGRPADALARDQGRRASS